MRTALVGWAAWGSAPASSPAARRARCGWHFSRRAGCPGCACICCAGWRHGNDEFRMSKAAPGLAVVFKILHEIRGPFVRDEPGDDAGFLELEDDGVGRGQQRGLAAAVGQQRSGSAKPGSFWAMARAVRVTFWRSSRRASSRTSREAAVGPPCGATLAAAGPRRAAWNVVTSSLPWRMAQALDPRGRVG
jgi:hypothetical protein